MPTTATVTASRPIAAPKAQAATQAANKLSPVAAMQPSLINTFDVVRTGAAVGQAAGKVAFTPPVIVDIFKSSIRSGLSLTNIAWFVVPSAIRNVRDVASDKISTARAGANVATEATFGIGRGIVAGAMVQCLSIATGPLMGLLPISPAILPFVGIGVGLAGLVGTHYVLGKIITKTGIDQKMADALTHLFGGDKPGTLVKPQVQ
jgi:hypothetical protein